MSAEATSDYEARYVDAKDHQKAGDKSPQYGPSVLAADRIAEHNPNAKIIWMLRNPVARAISQCGHAAKRGTFGPDYIARHLDEFEQGPPSERNFVFRSRYDLQLPVYDQLFEHVHVCLFEDFVKDPEGETELIQDFIGVKRMKSRFAQKNPTPQKAREQIEFAQDQITRLKQFVAPSVDYIEERLGRNLPKWRAQIAN